MALNLKINFNDCYETEILKPDFSLDKETRKKIDALLLKAKQCEDQKIKVTLKSGG